MIRYSDSSDKADELYRKSVKLDPENPDLLNTFAGFLVKNKGDINEFTAVIDKALSLALTFTPPGDTGAIGSQCSWHCFDGIL